VEPQVQQAIYVDQLQPALRVYLTKQREEAYIDIKPGFVDAGSSRKETKPVFTSYAPPVIKKKIQAKQRMEQERAAKAQAALAAAREKVAEKQAAKAEADAHKAGSEERLRAGQAAQDSSREDPLRSGAAHLAAQGHHRPRRSGYHHARCRRPGSRRGHGAHRVGHVHQHRHRVPDQLHCGRRPASGQRCSHP
jgi:hypothetical protein